MHRENNENKIVAHILYVVMPIAFMPILLNIWASRNYVNFGMTAPELIKELWLILLYFIIGGILIVFAGHNRKKSKIIFGVRLAIVASVFALSYNQIAISKTLAPVKKEFQQVAGQCAVRSKDLVCGKELASVLNKRDQILTDMNAIRFGDWRITAVNRHTIVTDRDSAYFYLPF